MQPLQKIQNTLCRIVTGTHRFSSITGPLSSLHWLPVRYRIQFKINLLTYKVYKTDYPVYLKDCVQPYRSAYNTRCSEPAQHMLNVPYYDYKQYKSFTHLSNNFFFILHHDFGTHCQRLSMCSFIECFSFSVEGIFMDKGISSLDFFFHINFSSSSRLFFCSSTMSLIIPNDVRPECVFAQIRRYRNLID